MLRVRVPATSANLGSGFDMAALALDLYNQFDIKRYHRLVFKGFDPRFNHPDNLVYQSYLKALKHINPMTEAFTFHITLSENAIPVARGLGSSASCIIAGIMAANHFHELNLEGRDIFQLAVKLEGHADNVGAAIYGGLISVMQTGKEYTIIKHDIHKSFTFDLFIPDFTGDTKTLRDVVPTDFHRQDVVYQLERVAALFKAFKDGDITLLKEAVKDGIHQNKRIQVLKLYTYIHALSNDDCVMVLSGSGPTLLRIRGKGKVLPEQTTTLNKIESLQLSNGTTIEVLK